MNISRHKTWLLGLGIAILLLGCASTKDSKPVYYKVLADGNCQILADGKYRISSGRWEYNVYSVMTNYAVITTNVICATNVLFFLETNQVSSVSRPSYDRMGMPVEHKTPWQLWAVLTLLGLWLVIRLGRIRLSTVERTTSNDISLGREDWE